MIFTESTIKISNNVSKMDSTIVLYRGDKNVEIRFTILQSPFKYSNTVATNVIESTNASYGQLVIKTPNSKPPIFSEVSATKEGTVLFTITKEMIDEIEEVGVYTFQIRLMDENKQSRVTIPPVENGIEIKEPIAIEDDNTTNVVGLAKANYAVVTSSDVDTPTFDDNGKYNKTNWNDGDIITNASLNKIEDGIYTANENVTATKKYVDDNILIEQLPILRIDETKKRIYVDCNNMGTYKKYFVPNKYANVYGFSFIYTNEDKSETEIALVGGAMTRDDFILCARNTNTLFILILGGTDKYTYTKSTKTLEKGLYGYLKIGNTHEYTPTENYHPATKKYVDDNRDYYFKVPTILYDDPNMPKGYVDITTLEQGTNYRVNSSIVSGFFKVSLKAPNDDGTWFTVDDGSNTIGWSSMLSTSICVQLKSDTFIAINMNCINNYCKYLSITKENGKWKLMQTKLDSISPDNTYEYDVTNDYNPAHKKYVDDNTPIKSLPVNPTTKTGAVVDVNNITVSGGYALPKRSDGAHWTNLMMRAMINDGSGKGKSLLLSGYQNYVFHVNVESKKIYCDNLRIVYNIGTTADTTDIRTEPYFLPTTNTKEYTPTNDYNPATKKYVDDNMKTAINGVKGDLGTEELTTTAKDLRGAVNELNTQCKDIASKTITTEERTKLTSLENYDDTTVKNDIQTQKARIDSLTTLTEGSTTGDAELIDGRTGADGVTYTNIGDAIRTQCGNLNTLLDVKYEPISNNCIDDSKFVGKNFDSIFGHNGNKKFKLAKKLTSNRIKGYIELEDGTTPSTAFQIYLTTSVEGIQGVEDIQLSIGGTLVVSDDFDKFDTISVDCWQIYDKNIKTFFIGNYADEYDNYKTQPKSKALENVDSKISNIPPEQCTFFTKVDNLLKNVNLQKGYGINPNHGMPDKLTGIERTTTDFMELRDDCKSTYCNINGYIYYYDVNKKYLQSISPQNLETPAGIVALPQSDTKIKYIRYTFVTEDDAALATYWITDQGKPYENDKLYISKDKIEDMTKTESWYKGKKICAYGDSVTEQNKWQSFVSSYFNCSFYNKGVGGTTVTQINSSTNHMSGDTRIETIPTDSDVVLVFGGHNDWSNASINMGDIKTDALSESTSFKSAFGLMLKKIQTRCPNAKIITMTPVGGRTEEASTNQDKQFYIRDLCMSDFANAVKEVSAYYGIPCIDINANSGINTLNHTTYIADLIHPNLEGGKLIANEVINGLKRFEPIVF